MIKIVSNTIGFIPKEHIIEIVINYSVISESLDIAASKIVGKSSSSLDEDFESLKERFHTFALNVSNYVTDHDFIIEDEHPSNRNNSLSYYITFYPTDEDGNVRDKHLIFLRLSDHNINNLSDRSRKYHKNTANKFKRSQDKNQRYIFENIVVNGHTCKTFASALDTIYDILDDMQDGSYFE